MFNGVGVFTRVYQWVNDAALGTFVDATRMDTDSNDIADGLTNCVTRDGQSPPTANLPMGGFKWTGMGNGSANTDSVNYGQVFNSPAFVTPTATTSPAFGDRSLRLSTTAWVGAEFAPLASPPLTGTPTAPTAAPGTNTTQLATTAFATALAFSATLPAQVGNAYKVITTNGTTASWTDKLDDSTIRFANNADPTKKLAFDLSGLTTATTRTVALPDKSGTLAMISDFPQIKLCTAQLDKTSDTALATIPGFTATLVAGVSYKFAADVYTTAIAGGGVKFGFAGTATATGFVSSGQFSETGNTVATARITSLVGTIGSSNASGTLMQIVGTFVCNAGGTFILQFAQQTSNVTASSVLVNSTFTVERIY